MGPDLFHQLAQLRQKNNAKVRTTCFSKVMLGQRRWHRLQLFALSSARLACSPSSRRWASFVTGTTSMTIVMSRKTLLLLCPQLGETNLTRHTSPRAWLARCGGSDNLPCRLRHYPFCKRCPQSASPRGTNVLSGVQGAGGEKHESKHRTDGLQANFAWLHDNRDMRSRSVLRVAIVIARRPALRRSPLAMAASIPSCS